MKDIHFSATSSWLSAEIQSIPLFLAEGLLKCTASARHNTITVEFPDGKKEIYTITDEEYAFIEYLESIGSMDGTLF